MEIKLYIKTKPASWDGYQRLAFALIFSSLEIIRDVYENKNDKEINLIDYAMSINFVNSPMFEYYCDFCEIDHEKIKEKINDMINQDLKVLGDEDINRLEALDVVLKLKNNVKIDVKKF